MIRIIDRHGHVERMRLDTFLMEYGAEVAARVLEATRDGGTIDMGGDSYPDDPPFTVAWERDNNAEKTQ